MEAREKGAGQDVFLDRASRATRGKRMTKLLDEELEEDEQFWNQDALKEDENDEEYEEEKEIADVYDSDFDEDEPELDEEGEKEPDEREKKKKKLIFPGKQSKIPKKKIKLISKPESTPFDGESPEPSTPSEHQDVYDDAEALKTVRKSTRTSVIIRQAERDAIRAALQSTMKPIKRKKEGEEKKMTQEEMLLEAAQTEVMNLRNLQKVLAREEEVKRRAIAHKEVYSGPQIRYLSRNGTTYLTFMNGSTFGSDLSTGSPQCPEKVLCAVTGLPARYRDPKTGLPYATTEAFKIIRERFAEENARRKMENSVPLLVDPSYVKGFSHKRQRSVMPRDKETAFRPFARFRKIPAPEIVDSG